MAHLVFQTAFPGDAFLSVPLLKRIRQWDPESRIVLACRPGLKDFFLKHELADEVIEIDKKSAGGRALALKNLRAQVWDVIFVPHESPRTALWIWRLRAKRAKIGFAKWWNRFIFTHRVQKPTEYPDALRQLSLLTPVDFTLAEIFGGEDFEQYKNPQTQDSPLRMNQPTIPEFASMRVFAGRSEPKKIFLAPGSVWATKRWTESGYAALAQLLIRRGYQVELVGSQAEKELCDRISQKVGGVINHAGRTSLAGLVELLATGEALVSNDSGAMHAAASSGLPTVAIFGPTTLALGFRPWNDRSVVVQKRLKCRPCGKHGAERCPIGTHECMESITPGEVLTALEDLIDAR